MLRKVIGLPPQSNPLLVDAHKANDILAKLPNQPAEISLRNLEDLSAVLGLLSVADGKDFLVALGPECVTTLIMTSQQTGQLKADDSFYKAVEILPEKHRINFISLLGSDYLRIIHFNASDLEKLLHLIPKQQWLSCITALDRQFVRGLFDASHITISAIINQLPMTHKIRFIAYLGESFTAYAVAVNDPQHPKIKILDLLHSLPYEKRSSFIRLAHAHIIREIQSASQLANVLWELPSKSGEAFVDAVGYEYIKGFLVKENALSVIESLPKRVKTNIISGLSHDELIKMIKSSRDLRELLTPLSDKQKIHLIEKLTENYLKKIITTGSELEQLLLQLPENFKYNILQLLGTVRVKEILMKDNQLVQVISKLPSRHRFQAIKDLGDDNFKECVFKSRDLSLVLKFLSDDEKAVFIPTLGHDWLTLYVTQELKDPTRELIGNYNDYSTECIDTFSALPESDRIALLKKINYHELADITNNSTFFQKIMAALPEEKQSTFVKALGYRTLVSKGLCNGNLSLILHTVPESERLNLIKETFEYDFIKNNIPDNYSLYYVLAALPGDKRLSFLTTLGNDFVDKISNRGGGLRNILVVLVESDRLKFIQQFGYDSIHKNDKIPARASITLSFLPEKDQLTYIKAIGPNHIINALDSMHFPGEIFDQMTEYDRSEFITSLDMALLEETICKSYTNILPLLLQNLPKTKRLNFIADFGYELLRRILSNRRMGHLEALMKQLDKTQRLIFINELGHQPIIELITDINDLFAILKLLPAKERQAIIKSLGNEAVKHIFETTEPWFSGNFFSRNKQKNLEIMQLIDFKNVHLLANTACNLEHLLRSIPEESHTTLLDAIGSAKLTQLICSYDDLYRILESVTVKQQPKVMEALNSTNIPLVFESINALSQILRLLPSELQASLKSQLGDEYIDSLVSCDTQLSELVFVLPENRREARMSHLCSQYVHTHVNTDEILDEYMVPVHQLHTLGYNMGNDEEFMSTNWSNERLAEHFIQLLHDHGITNETYYQHKNVIDSLTEIYKPNDETEALSYFIKTQSITIDDLPELFTGNSFVKNAGMTMHMLSCLSDAGYHPKTHNMLYQMVTAELVREYPDSIALCKFASAIPEASSVTDAEATSIDLLEEYLAEKHNYTYGPIAKSSSTRKLENIITQIASMQVDDMQITEKSTGEYILKCGDTTSYNLTSLIRNANLSHLELNDDVMTQLYEILLSLGFGDYKYKHTNPISDSFHDAERLALAIGTGNSNYLNINRFIRGETYNDSADDSVHTNRNKALITCFISGILINHAARRAPFLATGHKDKLKAIAIMDTVSRKTNGESSLDLYACLGTPASLSSALHLLPDNIISREDINFLTENRNRLAHLFPQVDSLLRREYLERIHVEQRTKNAYRLPSQTSYSTHKEGSSHFMSYPYATALFLGRSFHPLGDEVQGEVILPQGTQLVTQCTAPQRMIAKVVSSPMLERSDKFYSETALSYAYEKHLINAYSSPDKDQYTHQDIVVQRPNHGLAHTYRVMAYVDLVVQYFIQYALDEKMKDFCNRLGNSDLEWLRIAAAFMVTGRESEVSATTNLPLYETYREASAKHLKDFLQSNSLQDLTACPVECDSLIHVIRYLGNPAYEHGKEGSPPLNHCDNLMERNHRNFIFKILSFAHKLDTVRCFTPTHQMETLKEVDDWVLESVEQKDGLASLLRYAIEVNRAQGNRLTCDMNPSGVLIQSDENYQPPFSEVSHSIRALDEKTAAVRAPIFRAPGASNKTRGPSRK